MLCIIVEDDRNVSYAFVAVLGCDRVMLVWYLSLLLQCQDGRHDLRVLDQLVLTFVPCRLAWKRGLFSPRVVVGSFRLADDNMKQVSSQTHKP